MSTKLPPFRQGDEYESKIILRDTIKRWGALNGYKHFVAKSDPTRFSVKCASSNCSFAVTSKAVEFSTGSSKSPKFQVSL